MSNSGKVKCTCGWSWNKSDSSKKDMYICHECGRDNSNNMKNGGWLDSYADGGTMQEHQENYNDPQVSLPEGFVGMGNNTKGRNYSPAWGGQFQMGGNIYPVNYVPQSQNGEDVVSWTKEYVKSPKYKERITNAGYDDPDKQIGRRLQNLENVNIVDTSNPRGTVYKPSKNTIETGYPTDLEYYNIHKNLYPTKPELDSIIAHELGHSETNRQGSATSLLNKRDREELKNRLRPGSDEDLEVYINGELKHDRSKHNIIPEENKSDLNSFRYDLRNIYDAGNEDFTEEYLKNSPDSFAKERLLKNYSPEDLIWLMNNVAQNKESNQQGDVAQMGASIPGAVGFSYARTQSPAPSNGKYAKKTMASAQNGQEMKYYQEGLDFKPKSISKNGGWLDGYDVAQNGYNFDKINIREVPEIVRDNTRVVFRDEKGKQREVNPNKQITTTKTKYNKAEKEKALVAERRAKLANSMAAQNENYTSDNWRELLARETQATGDKFRLFPEEDSFIDNWLNPGVMIGNMASNLGQAPYQAEQTDSYMPYVTAIGTPLTVGALAGYGANSNSQFVNNLVNPLAGINPLTGLKNTVKKIPYGETAIPFAWKSRANELGQIESQAMFDAIKQSEKLTEADKVLLAEYQFDSAPFTGTGFGSSPEKRAALQKIIDKVNPEFQSNTVLTRRINADNASLFNNENGIIQIGDRPTSFSAGLGADANFGKDRFVLSGQNAKAVEANFLKNPYEELAPETIDDLQNFTDITHPGFTGKPESYTNYKGEVMTNMPLTDNAGFVNELNQTAVEKELIGSGFDFKQLGKVKNDLGGYDYIVKPTNIQNRNIFNETPIQRQGFPNLLGTVDSVIPRPPTPGMLLGMEDSWNNYSPFNLIPGYGEKLSARSSHPNFVGFRKFGNSIQDVIESQSLRPKGTGMGSKQIMSEGNWAEPGKVNENYSGVFEATMNPQIQGSNIKLEKWNKRNGIVGTTQEGDVAIPLTDTGLSFNRRLPFSNRYIPIDKDKLINNQFQLSTQLPHLQSLVEKYGLWAGGAGAAGYFTGGSEGAKENINTLNKYTIDPLIDFTKPYYNQAKKEFTRKTSQSVNEYQNGGWLNKYDVAQAGAQVEYGSMKSIAPYLGIGGVGAAAASQTEEEEEEEDIVPTGMKQGGIIKDDRGQWDHPGEITEIGSNQITMKGVPYPVLGVSNTGDTQMMYPEEEYEFDGEKVTEYPIAQNGFDAKAFQKVLDEKFPRSWRNKKDINIRETNPVKKDNTNVKQKNEIIIPTKKENAARSIQDQKQYMKDWMDSPMYNEMVDNSTTGISDEFFLNLSRDHNYDTAKVTLMNRNLTGEDKNVGANSNSTTGAIKVFPKGYQGPQLEGMISHEISHTVDKPVKWKDKARSIHEFLGNPYMDEKRIIPKKDIDLMQSYYKGNDYYKELFNKNALNNAALNKDREWFNYVSDPTETRARLNDIRYNAKKYNIYDPFTEKVDVEKLNEIRKLSKKAGGFDPFNQLRDVYSEDQIINMLNTISQNDTEEDRSVSVAKNGIRQEQKGLQNLDQLTNFTNYNKPQPGGWLNKYN